MSFGSTKKRSEPREKYHSSLEFVLKSDPEKTIQGLGTNISKSGLGIFSFAPLNEGQEIIMKNKMLATHPSYTVRWSIKIIEDFFIAGLHCSEC